MTTHHIPRITEDDVHKIGVIGWLSREYGDGDRNVLFQCPGGFAGSLSKHEIASDGLVRPSVLCTCGCGYHEYIVLNGWPHAWTKPEGQISLNIAGSEDAS
jgi:hypothetical protein